MKQSKTKILALVMALLVGSVALLTGSMFALAELPAEETAYERDEFVDESLFVSDEVEDETTEDEAFESDDETVADEEAAEDETVADEEAAEDETVTDEEAAEDVTVADESEAAKLKNFIDWAVANISAGGFSKEECIEIGTLNYILSHLDRYWYENYNFELPAEIVEAYGTADSEQLPPIMVYKSIGEKDCTETIEISYYGIGANGNAEWNETVTIDVPAGETVFYVLDNQGYETVFGGYAIRAGSYGDLYAEVIVK